MSALTNSLRTGVALVGLVQLGPVLVDPRLDVVGQPDVAHLQLRPTMPVAEAFDRFLAWTRR